MPWKPKVLCSYSPGCPEFVGGTILVKTQEKKENQRRYNKYERDPLSGKRYLTEDGVKIREQVYPCANPLCEQCLKLHDVMTAA